MGERRGRQGDEAPTILGGRGAGIKYWMTAALGLVERSPSPRRGRRTNVFAPSGLEEAMRTVWLPLVAAFFAIPAFAAPADDRGATADRYLTARTRLGVFNGAVLIAQGDRVLLRKGYGFADVAKRTPYTPETQHAVASITKMFTAMAALELRDAGKLDLEGPISRWVEECPASWNAIRITDLIHHTSGIPDYEERLDINSDAYLAFMTRPEATAEILKRARIDTLDFAPGTKFSYSNTAYILLASIVERAAGMPFAEYLQKKLIDPAGMKTAGMFGGPRAPRSLDTPYTHGDLGWEKVLGGFDLAANLQPRPRLALTPPAGDAGLFATVDDLLQWSRAMDGGRLFSRARVKEALTPGKGNYAFGWFADTAFGAWRVRHNGILPGSVSDFIRFPDQKITIVLFSNDDRTRMSRLARDLSAIIMGKPWDMPVEGHVVALDTTLVPRLRGAYRTENGDTLMIGRDPDFMTASIRNRYTAGLIPMGRLEFYMPLTDGRATFTLDDRRQAAAVNLRYSGEDHRATRIDSP